MQRLWEKFQFLIETWLVRGLPYQLLLLSALIALISLAGGVAVLFVESGFDDLGRAVWWAFLRLTDPGYLGDDEGAGRRVISTIITVAGYVLFLGVLIATMTQAFFRVMRRLESGIAPIRLDNHILVFGWTNRTPNIIIELLTSQGRVKRFLKKKGASDLRIVLVAEQLNAMLVEEIKDQLEGYWDPKRIILRSGTPLKVEHLERVDFGNAGVIIIPGRSFVERSGSNVDAQSVKTLLAISKYLGDAPAPKIVAEVFDYRRKPVAESAYKGHADVLASDTLIARLLAQNIRHPGLSLVYAEMLTHLEGNEVYVLEYEELAGRRWGEIEHGFPEAIPIGILQGPGDRPLPTLNPPKETVLEENDRIAFLSPGYMKAYFTEPSAPGLEQLPKRKLETAKTKRVLVLGWSFKVPSLLLALESHKSAKYEIDILTVVPEEKRRTILSRYDLPLSRVTVHHMTGDYTAPTSLRQMDLRSYDGIVFLASDWVESGEVSDARTILGYLLLREVLKEEGLRPQLVVELLDPDNEPLLAGNMDEVLISPIIISHMLANIALRTDLDPVFDELFGGAGPDFQFQRPSAYGVEAEGEVTFSQVRQAVSACGDIAVGMARPRSAGVWLNPTRDSIWHLDDKLRIIVLASELDTD